VYLASAREHPPAVAVRQQQRDVSLAMQFVRDLSQRQLELFIMVATFLARYQPGELQPIIDDDVKEAASALAATYETASRGLIYDHRPASLPAERLVTQLKPLLLEAEKNGGTAFERDTAVVLRRVAESVGETRALDADNRRAFLELLGRVMRPQPGDTGPDAGEPEPSRLIIPG